MEIQRDMVLGTEMEIQKEIAFEGAMEIQKEIGRDIAAQSTFFNYRFPLKG